MQDVTDTELITRPEKVPEDINAETFYRFYPENTFAVKFCGRHKRNAYKDILEIEATRGKLLIQLGRNSLYNSLPEYLFHSIDRFDNIPEREKKERFAEEYAKQEREKEQAYKFFAPIDTLLFSLRIQVKQELEKYAETNRIIQHIILDKLTSEQKENRFIKKTIPYVTSCRFIRGDRTLITLLLRKVLGDEGIMLDVKRTKADFMDANPRYPDSVGADLGEVFAGNRYSDSIIAYYVSYWSDDECDSNFLSFVDEMEVYRQFVQDYFLSVDSILEFDISKDTSPLRLSDTAIYNYLNFNTNI